MDDGTARIELRRKSGPSMWAVVDLEDYDIVRRGQWHASVESNTTYAYGRVAIRGRIVRTQMHRFIVGAPPGIGVDHVDHDGLNNRRSNLRLATQTQNHGNRLPTGRGSSRYKGVCFDRDMSRRRHRRWKARVTADGIVVDLGRFESEIEAALAYDVAARRIFGEFALVNFPEADIPA